MFRKNKNSSQVLPYWSGGRKGLTWGSPRKAIGVPIAKRCQAKLRLQCSTAKWAAMKIPTFSRVLGIELQRRRSLEKQLGKCQRTLTLRVPQRYCRREFWRR